MCSKRRSSDTFHCSLSAYSIFLFSSHFQGFAETKKESSYSFYLFIYYCINSMGMRCFGHFTILLPCSLFVLRLVDHFPLTSCFQTITSSAMKGNSESDHVNHNMHRLHQCCKLSVWSQQVFLFFFKLKAEFQSSGGNNSVCTPEKSLHCQEQIWPVFTPLSVIQMHLPLKKREKTTLALIRRICASL